MNKRITSLLLCLVMIVSVLVTAVPVFAVSSHPAVTFTIKPDKTTASPGDTITYTITLGPVEELQTAEFKLVIPDELEYKAGSNPSGLAEKLGAEAAIFTASTKKFNMYGAGKYTSTKDTVLATFSCEVKEGTIGTTPIVEVADGFFFTDADGEDYECNYNSDIAKVSITAAPKLVTGITLNRISASIEKGKTLQLKATVTPDNATNKAVTWTSSNTKIATVSSTGKVTAKAAGTVTITCTAKDGSGKKATCKVTVTNPVVKATKVTLNKTKATLSPKETLTLKATVTPTNATNKGVTWKSSNTKIATVSSTGKVTAKAAGTVTITCTAKDGSGKKATCKITVYNNTQAYVARIYTKALGREAEPAGLNYWVAEISTKRRTPVQVAEEFFFAPEFVNKKLNNTEYVKVLYRTFMGREYDKSGLDYWVARLNKGESRKSVLEAFAGCPEFQKIVKSFGL